MSIGQGRRVLLVEDDADIANLVRLHLEDEGYAVTTVATADEARRALIGRRAPGAKRGSAGAGFDLVILDRMLPDTDGIEICRELRREKDYVPVLMLTARAGEMDRVLGLELGADDYLTKPFSIPELLARTKAILRRTEAMRSDAAATGEKVIRVGDLSIDPARRAVTVSERPVSLTVKEFDLLLLFARHPGRVFTRSQLLEQVWGYGHSGYEHTVNSHINRLRAKIELEPSDPRYLLTVWGVGYRFFDPVSVADA